MITKLVISVAFSVAGIAQTGEAEVRRVLDQQAADWNRGDIPSFVKYYASDAVFIGKEIARGSQGVLERYRRNYPTRESMGKLTFSDIEVQMIGADHALVIGRFHLERTAAGGGDARGIYSLVLRKTRDGWRIVLDHTS
jgi:uncharacterized protein (TIGR02246 family)